VRLLPWLGLIIVAACSDDAEMPDGGATINLPERDASAVEVDAQTCDTQKDPENCGTCGHVCPSGPRGTAACNNGTCVLACDDGWGDCNGNVFDGCEADVTSSVEHCGACARDCRTCGGTKCTNSACDVADFATATAPITLLNADADHVTYATDRAVKQITRTTLADESVLDVDFTPWIQATKTNVLFIVPGTDAFAGIYATAPGFVGPQIAAYGRGENVDTFAFDDTGAYFASQKKDSQARQLVRCNNCTVPTVLSETENRFSAGAIALDPTTVFFGSADMIRRVEKTAERLKTIAVGQSARSMQVDADYIYWINEDTSDVARLAKAGGDVEIIAKGLTKPRWLSLAGDRLYVGADEVVFRMQKDGSARLDLVRASVPVSIGPIAVDQACVFLAAGNAVRRVTR